MAGGGLFRIATSNLNQTLEMVTQLVDQCNSMSQLKQIHAILVVTSALSFHHSHSQPVASKILSFSALSHHGDIHYSHRFLLHLPNRTLFHWNTIVRGFSASDEPCNSISVFVQMLRLGLSPDNLTFPFLAKAAARLRELRLGLSLQARVTKSGFEHDCFVANSFIHMYSACGDVGYARRVFDEMPTRTLVSWNAMLNGYAKCGDMGSARELFESMPPRDVVSWSSLIDGYVKSGEHREAMALFQRMLVEGQKANEVTMVSVLCACAHLGALEQGRTMHRYIVQNNLPFTLVLCTSVVDMYAKCGAIEEAMGVFRGGLMRHTDVLMWNAVIGGLATHGLVEECFKLFAEMQENRIHPDEVTYLCMMSACAHGGLVSKAWHFLDCVGKLEMRPKSEHYACMVDVLARAGQLEEAYEFLCQMPMEPTAPMLGALLSGCMNHGKVDLAEVVGRKLIELEPDHGGRYVGLANIFAVSERWDDKRRTREAMERRGMKKPPAFSSIEVSGMLHRFTAHDKTHPSSEHLFRMLSLIRNQMKLSIDHKNQESSLYDTGNLRI